MFFDGRGLRLDEALAAAVVFPEDCMRFLLLLLCGCAHAVSQPAAGHAPERAELAKVVVSVAPETLLNDPVLQDRVAGLRTALAAALREEGFTVADAAPLRLTSSVDFTPWTSVNSASVFVVLRLVSEGGEIIDQVEERRIDEGFPEAAKVPELARGLARRLARSPRLNEYLHPR